MITHGVPVHMAQGGQCTLGQLLRHQAFHSSKATWCAVRVYVLACVSPTPVLTITIALAYVSDYLLLALFSSKWLCFTFYSTQHLPSSFQKATPANWPALSFFELNLQYK